MATVPVKELMEIAQSSTITKPVSMGTKLLYDHMIGYKVSGCSDTLNGFPLATIIIMSKSHNYYNLELQ